MDYKKIIPSQTVRFFILKMFQYLPASTMLKLQYFIKFNRRLNLKDPQRFTEKLQHYKLNYRNENMRKCTDKYQVRYFIEDRGYKNYLNELYGVYNSADKIDFSKLPNQFVIKTTDGGGGENIIICRDKTNFDIEQSIEKLKKWQNKKLNNMTYEWAYDENINSKIIIEKYLEDPNNSDKSIDDYKFFCFNGRVDYLVVDVDRYSGHKRNFYDTDWNHIKIASDCPMTNRDIKKPANFNEMIAFAKAISKGFPFVRVDLYNINGKILFGEMTFYPWSGYVQFSPDDFDFELGKYFHF